jgi:hypothetical protein
VETVLSGRTVSVSPGRDEDESTMRFEWRSGCRRASLLSTLLVAATGHYLTPRYLSPCLYGASSEYDMLSQCRRKETI